MTDVETLMHERLAALAPSRLEIVDESARHAGHPGAHQGGHYRLLIVSAQFSGKTTLQRHRLVHDTLGELMRSKIHALSIRSLAPDEAS